MDKTSSDPTSPLFVFNYRYGAEPMNPSGAKEYITSEVIELYSDKIVFIDGSGVDDFHSNSSPADVRYEMSLDELIYILKNQRNR